MTSKKRKYDHYVYSTLSAGVEYTGYKTGGANDLPAKNGVVYIAGGANVADTNFVTPRGVVTGVSNDELEFLRGNTVFQLHEANGYITVTDSLEDEDVVVSDMTGRDPSAPLVDADFKEGATPKTASRKA